MPLISSKLVAQLLVVVLALAGWAREASAQCSKDTDCKGDRVCYVGACVAPRRPVEPPAEELAVDDEASRPAPEPWRASFATIDRGDAETRLGVELGISFVDGGEGLRADLHGQYLTPRGLGGYASLALTKAIPDLGDNINGANDLELGGLYVHARSWGELVARAGLALPTASEDIGVTANHVAALSRITDYALVAPDVTWLRLSASPLLRRGPLVLRGDVGLDLPVVNSEPAYSADALLRVNVGAGYVHEQVAILGELTSIGFLGEEGSAAEIFFHTLAVTVRSRTGMTRPVASFILPLDEALASFSWILVVGFEVAPTLDRR